MHLDPRWEFQELSEALGISEGKTPIRILGKGRENPSVLSSSRRKAEDTEWALWELPFLHPPPPPPPQRALGRGAELGDPKPAPRRSQAAVSPKFHLVVWDPPGQSQTHPWSLCRVGDSSSARWRADKGGISFSFGDLKQ